MAEHILFIEWQKLKKEMSEMDNLVNTGNIKSMMLEIILMLCMNYPFAYGVTYTESFNSLHEGQIFFLNDLLLCIMIGLRLKQLIKPILEISFYTDPRAQRVCSIYGCEANNSFAIKAMFKNDSPTVLGVSWVFSLICLAYQLRLFERQC